MSFKRKKSKKSAATKEFDEIFGKLNETPQASSDALIVEDDDKFSVESTSDSIQTNKKLFKKFKSRANSFFSRKKSSNLLNKSRSVEVLYTNNNKTIQNGSGYKSQSRVNFFTDEIYYDDDDISVDGNEMLVDYLNQIDGLSILGMNPNLKYIWHQLATCQEELLFPFQELLRSLADQLHQAYSKCQELEILLTRKNEQRERNSSRLYDEIEQTIQQEKAMLQEKFLDREEQMQYETNRLIELKDIEIQELSKRNEEYDFVNNRLQQEYDNVQSSKESAEVRLAQLEETVNTLKKDNEKLIERNATLEHKLKESEDESKQFQDHINQLSEISSIEKENCKHYQLKYQETVEEKELMNTSIKNLSIEMSNLTLRNMSLLEQLQVKNSLPDRSPAKDKSSCLYVKGENNSESSSENEDSSLFNKKISIDEGFNDQNENICRRPRIKTPTDLTPINITIDENHEIADHVGQMKKFASKSSRKAYSASTPKRKESTKFPLQLASSVQREFKVIFTGDMNAGKTSLIRRIHSGKFRATNETTIEADYYLKTIEYNDNQVPLKLWDTVGQERFKSIPVSYFRRSDVVILMYDIADESTFINAKQWIKTIHDYTDENIFLILVGNKVDLFHKRKVEYPRGRRLAKDHDAMFIETSAKNGENVNELCEMIASTLLDRDDTVIIRNDFESSLCSMNYANRKKSSECCAG